MDLAKGAARQVSRHVPFSVISKLLVGGTIACWATSPCPAFAEPPPAVDVVLRDPPPVRRILAVEWNPLALLINRLSGNVDVIPFTHHGLVLSPFYFSSRTAEVQTMPVTPSQKFEGWGGEIGYRYYTGDKGPRGFFFGPSLLLAWVQATGGNGTTTPRTTTSFTDTGVAADIGYQTLVDDRWSITLGAGVQYTFTSKTIPDQPMPAAIYANGGFEPRAIVSLGYAL
jgi:Protein of unknown function (DUF3575)